MISPRQANVMDHALAFPKQYRNRFYATPGTLNDATWLELVELGYATASKADNGNYNLYRVTNIGVEALILYHDYKGKKA